MAWCPFKFKITHFLLVYRNNKSCDIFVFYVPFLWGSFRCNITATTFFLLHGISYGLECGLVFVVLT